MTLLCICAVSLLEANMQVKKYTLEDLCYEFIVFSYKDFQRETLTKQNSY